MTRVYRFEELCKFEEMALDMINSFDSFIKESKEPRYKQIAKKILNDLHLSINSTGIYGAGVALFYPIVSKLIQNTRIENIGSPENIVLATICAASILYLEDKKYRDKKEQYKIEKDSKSMLEELKLKGIGNGIIKKIVKAFLAIKNIFTTITRQIGPTISGFIDMFAYVSLLVPIMNGIFYIIGKYDLNLDTIVQNFMGLAIGVGTIIAKHGIIDIVKRLKGKFKKINKKKLIDTIQTPVVQKFGSKIVGDEIPPGTKMIQEQ